MDRDERPAPADAGGFGAFAPPAGALPVLVIERAGREAVWDELLLQPSPPRPIRFTSEAEADGDPLRPAPAGPARPSGPFVLAAAGAAAGTALRIAAADDRVAALLLVDPLAEPVDLDRSVALLIVRSGDHADDGFALPDGDARAAAVARVRAALAAPPFVPPAPR